MDGRGQSTRAGGEEDGRGCRRNRKQVRSRQRAEGEEGNCWRVARWRLLRFDAPERGKGSPFDRSRRLRRERANDKAKKCREGPDHVRFGNLGPPLCRQTRDALALSEIPHELIHNKLLSSVAGGVGRRRIWRVGMLGCLARTPRASHVRRYGEERRCQSNVTLPGCRGFSKCRILAAIIIGRQRPLPDLPHSRACRLEFGRQ